MRTPLMLCAALAVALNLLIGCAEEDYAAEATVETAYLYDTSESSDGLAQAYHEADREFTEKVSVIDGRAGEDLGVDPDTPPDARKIIYNAHVDLVVDEFNGVAGKVQALAKKHGGFIARSSIQGSEGEPRRGEWTLRIPAGKYDAFLTGTESLGQLRSKTSDSQEVTAEYVDLEARLRNSRAEEARLHEHLNESTKSLKDILAVEKEIARVRGEIERAEGRLNVLKDLTALSTVTVSVQEIKDYVPEPTEEPGFGTKVARTWDSSVDGLGGFFTRLSLGVVALVPWLVVIAPLGLVAYLLIRKARRALTHTTKQAATA